MEETIIKIIPLITGSAVVPLEIMMVILLLNSSSQGLTKAILLVAGMTTIRLLQGIIFSLILSVGENTGKSAVVSTLPFVLGIFLLITAYKQWRNEDDSDDPPPKRIVKLDTLTPHRVNHEAILLQRTGKIFSSILQHQEKLIQEVKICEDQRIA